MATQSLYAQVDAELLRPLTDLPCPHAPQAGVVLYHFPLSLCSQKARQVLEEKGVPWSSRVILLTLYQQYDPDYVRINPRCVVPTLVRDGRVTTDSENIMRHVDATFEGPRLVPEDPTERASMEHFLALGDALFMEALTYGELPGVHKPMLMRRASKGSHAHKLELLDGLIREHGDDANLRACYEAKRGLVARTVETMDTQAGMSAVLDATEASFAELAEQLAAGPFGRGGWLCSDEFCLADLEWGVVLYRLRWLGLGPKLWGEREPIRRYADRLFARPGFQAGVTSWDRPLRQIVMPTLIGRLGAMLGR